MAEILGSALLSAFFSVLFERLATQEVLNFLRPKKVINKLLEELKVLSWSADELLDDAEEKLIHNPRVENWHNKLKDVVYKASELIDKIETEALRHKLEGHQSASNLTKIFKKLCSTSFSSFDNDVKHELEGILSSLKLLLGQKEALGLEAAGRNRQYGGRTRLSEGFRPTPVADESSFCGREDIKAIIIESVLRDVSGESITVIPIVGAGGLGKTSLAQMVFTHPAVEQRFGEVRAWVTVSTEFDLQTIIKKIIGKVISSSQVDGDVDQEDLLKLKAALKGKKFLFVLDDVWSEDYSDWNNLMSCFQSGEYGSKIIVTTRSAKVASIVAPYQPHHFLPELPEEDCLELFAKTVFTSSQDRVAHKDLQQIGKKIVEKCRGLPLSVISVGGILRGDRNLEKWNRVLKSNVWSLLQQNSKNIIPSLWLSYRYLPSHLKPCFAYSSIFPKDYQFEKKVVVQLWMAEGFLKNEAGFTLEEVGNQYLEELISRSLFQRSSEDEATFMMHDLVHDLAIYVSGKFCLSLDEDKIFHDFPCETRHLSAIEATKFEGLSKAKSLHSFVGLKPSFHMEGAQKLDVLKVLEEFSKEGGGLRVISLSRFSKIEFLPDSIGNLKRLRYLNLSRTALRKLPDSITTLYSLQTLLLSSCTKLTQLPSNIGRLTNLHHLDTQNSPLEEMPPEMRNLKNLQTLTDFVLGKERGSSIRDLGELHNLNGRLRVSGLQNVRNVEDVLEANLKDKNLSQLVLEWKGQSQERDSRQEEKVLELLQPHASSLKELTISEYGGMSFPDWVGDSSFSNIETVHLNYCEDCGSLPPLGRLASLKELKLRGFRRVETIDNKFYGDESSFRCLEVLQFMNLPEWKKWSFIEDDNQGGTFPCLQGLFLSDCPKLVGWLPNRNTITTLSLYNCKNFDIPWIHRYPSLEVLSINKSCGSMKSLPLDHFPKLQSLYLAELQHLLELTGDWPNELGRLYIKQCPKLEFLGNRRCASLKKLNIEKCEALKSIPLDYFPKLKEFTLKDCQNFESFTFAEEPPLVLESLSELRLDGLPKFVSFTDGGFPAPNIKTFYISRCENLESFPDGGLPSNLEELVIVECKKLTRQGVLWDLQTLTCLTSLIIEGCGELLDSCPPQGLLPPSLTSLQIHFTGLKTLNIHACQNLHYLTLEGCYELQSLPEESLPNSLSDLAIYNCPLLERRYQKETGEGWHKISHIPRVHIIGETAT